MLPPMFDLGGGGGLTLLLSNRHPDCFGIVGPRKNFPGWMPLIKVLWVLLLDGCCYFLVGCGWLLLFLGGLWMVVVNSGWALGGCSSFVVGSRWSRLLLGSRWLLFFTKPLPRK